MSAQRKQTRLKSELACCEPRKVKDIVDRGEKNETGGSPTIGEAPGPGIEVAIIVKCVCKADHRRQRRLQIVADIGKKLCLRLGCRLRALALLDQFRFHCL